MDDAPVAFSDELEAWLSGEGDKTLGQLGAVFEERSFAVAILVLMFPAALPLPTGGITHLLEVIALILSVELAVGARSIWLPRRLRDRPLGETLTVKALPFMVRRIRWFEQRSRSRAPAIFSHQLTRSLLGVFLAAMAIGAALAPPFTGLDTLPSLGAVVTCLAMLLGDALVLGIGLVLGLVGVGITAALGAATFTFLTRVL